LRIGHLPLMRPSELDTHTKLHRNGTRDDSGHLKLACSRYVGNVNGWYRTHLVELYLMQKPCIFIVLRQICRVKWGSEAREAFASKLRRKGLLFPQVAKWPGKMRRDVQIIHARHKNPKLKFFDMNHYSHVIMQGLHLLEDLSKLIFLHVHTFRNIFRCWTRLDVRPSVSGTQIRTWSKTHAETVRCMEEHHVACMKSPFSCRQHEEHIFCTHTSSGLSRHNFVREILNA
jgi:hypothetical protein